MKATVLLHTVIAFAVMVPAMSPWANAAERDADEAAVRHRTAEFVQALEAGVAKDIAGFWTSEGEYVGGDGVSVRGREALEAAYRSTMTDGATLGVSCEIEAIRFLSRDTAVVDGLFESAGEKAEEHHAAGFSILYVREDGQWRIAVLREWSRETTLADLDWLIGDWTTKVGNGAVRTSYSWDESRSFIFMDFAVEGEDHKVGGRQIIAQDPATGTLRSWLFQSGGGFGHAVWSREGKGWVVDSQGVNADGSEMTATNIFTPESKNSFTFTSINRTLDGESLPGIDRVTVKRAISNAKESD